MAYLVTLHGVTVGRSDLERLDPESGLARGVFHPGTGYQLIQDVFHLYTEATANGTDDERLLRYYKARDALGLEVLDPAGDVVTGTTVHVHTRSAADGKAAYELEVFIDNPGFWRRVR